MTTKHTGGPATPDEAEALAVAAVQQYLNACRMTHRDQIANYLMKLCSVSGVLMAHAEGSESAAERLEATAEFVRVRMPVTASRMVPVQ